MSSTPEKSPAIRLVALALYLWPRRPRERDGQALLQALREDLRSEDPRGIQRLTRLTSDFFAVAGPGLRMRWRDVRTGLNDWRTDWGSEVRHAVWSLRRSPGFTVTVGSILALGIGANAAVFSVVDQVLFRPPPFKEPDQLILVWNTTGASEERLRVPAPDAAEIQEHSPSLSSTGFMGRVTDGALEIANGGGADHVLQSAVTTNLFGLLGVRPALGRGFQPRDGDLARPDGQLVDPASVILAHEAWIRLLGGDREAIGREVLLNGRPVTVAGVMPAGFRIPMPPGTGMEGTVDVWVPLPTDLRAFRRPDGRRTDQDSDNTGAVVARLGKDVSLERVRAELGFLAQDLQARIPQHATSGFGFTARILWQDATRHLRGPSKALLMGVGLVLLITCLNLSVMVLARGTRRAPELTIRAALGAGRGRVVRQLATESVILVLPGAFLALLLAGGLSGTLADSVPFGLGLGGGGIDFRMLLFAAGLTLAVVLISGVAPAAHVASLEGSGRTGSGFLRGGADRSRLRGTLVTGQAALSVTLLMGTFLLLKTAGHLRTVDPGFNPAEAMTFHLSMRVPDRYPGPADRARLARSIVAQISDLPGVSAVGLTTHLPLSGRQWSQPYGLPGESADEWSGNRAGFRAVTSELFSALGVQVLEGRTFTSEEDLTEERRVVVVDRHMADLISTSPRESAVGVTIGIPLDGSEVYAEVVGVVGNVRYDRLDEDGREVIYVPYRQEASREVSFVIRTEGDPTVMAPSIRRAVREIDPQLAVYGLRSLESYVASAVAPTRFSGTVLAAFAMLALLALAIGLYGVVSLEVTRRTREIGLRMAVGADSRRMMALILTGGLRTVGWGVAIGGLLSVVSLRFLRSTFYDTGIVDPWAWVLVLVSLCLVSGVACWVPARRAAALDPTVALRSD